MFNNKRESYDIPCFKNSDLYNHLNNISDRLNDECLYVLGDYVRGIKAFLIPPYYSPLSKSPDDDYIFVIPLHASHWNVLLENLILGGVLF